MCTTDVYYSLPTKILIQEPIKDKFLYYKEKYEIEYEDCSKLRDVEIKVFRSKQELLTPKKSHFVNFVSIWSEDITTAKNLAISLNVQRHKLHIYIINMIFSSLYSIKIIFL